jgi:hypothetical protein
MKIKWVILLFLLVSKNGYSDESYFPQQNIEKISASSTLENRYRIENIIDNTWRSWAEGVEGNGIGESFTVEFKIPVKLSRFILKNGYGQLDYYYKNNRIKSFEIFIDDELTGTIVNIEDSYELEYYGLPQLYIFDDVILHGTYIECTKITFKINEIYPGTHYNDTCIAEIVFFPPELRGGGDILNYPDIWRTYVPDPYTVRLLRAFYEEKNISFRLDKNNRPQIIIFDGETGEYFWHNIYTYNIYPFRDGGYKIFLSPSKNPILLQIKRKYNNTGYIYSELSDIKEFVNNRWQNTNDLTTIIQIKQLENDIIARGLFCDFREWDNFRNRVYVLEIIVNAIRPTGDQSVGERDPRIPYEVVETYTFFWNGISFERR